VETLRYTGHSEESHRACLEDQARLQASKQHLRRFDEEKRRAIGKEIAKLLVAGFIKEVYHPEWLANPVLVKKKSRKWMKGLDG
jgi:hypothetical protein